MSAKHHIEFSTIPDLSQVRAAFPGLKAIFFDMDGTLFDSEKFHTQAMLELGAEHKILAPFSTDVVHQLLVGKADHLVFDLIKTWEGFPAQWTARDFVDAKNKKFLSILDRSSADFFHPKISSLLKEIKTAKIFIALVTSSETATTSAMLNLAGLDNFFQLVLTRNDCPKHKPDPWPYLEALKFAGTAPHETLIFEDSSVGLAAAEASGAHVVKAKWF